jgi:hypothetical protein
MAKVVKITSDGKKRAGLIEAADMAAGLKDANYVHTQDAAATTWTINHELGKVPTFVTWNTAGKRIFGAEYPGDMVTIIKFKGATAGFAAGN